MPLSVTTPAAGQPVAATDLETIAQEIADYTAAIPAGDVSGVPAHGGEHAPGATDNLDGSYVGVGTATIATGYILRAAFSFLCDAALPERGGIDYSIGAAITLFPSPGDGVYQLTFTGMNIARRYIYHVTRASGAALGAQIIAGVGEIVGNRLNIYTANYAGVATYLADGNEIHVSVYEILP